jgi:uncharacterized oxidoreductase
MDEKLVSTEDLRKICCSVLKASGASGHEAGVVADSLVESSLMGVDSHGIALIIQYVDELEKGIIKPGAPVEIVKETAQSALVDCGFNFGPVGASKMVELCIDKTRNLPIACVMNQRSHHTGRIGAYVQRLAEKGLVGIAFGAASTKYGKGASVAPWGGGQGRLGTNPLAYAVPTDGLPILFDVSTASIAKSRLSVLQKLGTPVPPGFILDRNGESTTDPASVLDGGGSILPFGGEQGHKGYGLALLCELLASGLAQDVNPAEDAGTRYCNSLFLIAIDPNAFSGSESFRHETTRISEYVKSSRPVTTGRPVLIPGEKEFTVMEQRKKEGVPVPLEIWNTIIEIAYRLGIQPPFA